MIKKCDVTCSLPPFPLSQTVTHSRTPSPLERDVLYGWPIKQRTDSKIEMDSSGEGTYNNIT